MASKNDANRFCAALQDALAPKLVELQQLCAMLRLDFGAAETLAMLCDSAPASRVAEALSQHPGDLEAVCKTRAAELVPHGARSMIVC
jgi:hypothetical protein